MKNSSKVFKELEIVFAERMGLATWKVIDEEEYLQLQSVGKVKVACVETNKVATDDDGNAIKPGKMIDELRYVYYYKYDPNALPEDTTLEELCALDTNQKINLIEEHTRTIKNIMVFGLVCGIIAFVLALIIAIH